MVPYSVFVDTLKSDGYVNRLHRAIVWLALIVGAVGAGTSLAGGMWGYLALFLSGLVFLIWKFDPAEKEAASDG